MLTDAASNSGSRSTLSQIRMAWVIVCGVVFAIGVIGGTAGRVALAGLWILLCPGLQIVSGTASVMDAFVPGWNRNGDAWLPWLIWIVAFVVTEAIWFRLLPSLVSRWSGRSVDRSGGAPRAD